MQRSRLSLFGIDTPITLSSEITIPPTLGLGVYKCRITYNSRIHSIKFILYNPHKIQSLKLVYDDEVNYSHKYEDRDVLHELLKQKSPCDDVLIVKQGWITDTSYSNVVFWDGEKWITPHTYLLAGTQRANLLENNKIHAREITPKDLPLFSHAKLINAMLDVNITTPIPIKAIL